MQSWQPAQYLKYEAERTQPATDLAARIRAPDPKRIIDIGCGPGNSTAVLKERWPKADIYGLDGSENMLQRAKKDFPDAKWICKDAGGDLSSLGKFDIVFSNAALQWMPAHECLIPRLFDMLAEGGTLAVQVPCMEHAPAYKILRNMAGAEKWAGYFALLPEYPLHLPMRHYYDIIATLAGQIQIWQTDYIHVMKTHDDIVEWYKGTGMRPYLDMLPGDGLKSSFCDEYRTHISGAYKAERDGKILFSFTRIFFTVYKS